MEPADVELEPPVDRLGTRDSVHLSTSELVRLKREGAAPPGSPGSPAAPGKARPPWMRTTRQVLDVTGSRASLWVTEPPPVVSQSLNSAGWERVAEWKAASRPGPAAPPAAAGPATDDDDDAVLFGTMRAGGDESAPPGPDDPAPQAQPQAQAQAQQESFPGGSPSLHAHLANLEAPLAVELSAEAVQVATQRFLGDPLAGAAAAAAAEKSSKRKKPKPLDGPERNAFLAFKGAVAAAIAGVVGERATSAQFNASAEAAWHASPEAQARCEDRAAACACVVQELLAAEKALARVQTALAQAEAEPEAAAAAAAAKKDGPLRVLPKAKRAALAAELGAEGAEAYEAALVGTLRELLAALEANGRKPAALGPAFDGLAKGGPGVDYATFLGGLRALGYDAPEAQRETLCAHFDRDGDGVVSKDEFVGTVRHLSKAVHAQGEARRKRRAAARLRRQVAAAQAVVDSLVGGLRGLEKLPLANLALPALPASPLGDSLRRLWLDGNGLAVLPDDLSALQALRSLDVSRNELRALPSRLPPGLERLRAGHNRLAAVPDALPPALIELHLGNNDLAKAPAALAGLANLRVLSLESNKLVVLRHVTGLAALVRLSAQGNRLEKLPDDIGALGQLQHLDVSQNMLSTLPPSIAQLQQLRSFAAQHNQLSSLTAPFCELQALVSLTAGSNQLTDLPQRFHRLASLRKCVLNNNMIAALPDQFGDLPLLAELDLHGNRLTALPDSFTRLRELATCRLHDNALARLPPQLQTLEAMAKLSLQNNRLTALPASIGSLRRLALLNVAHNELADLPSTFGQLAALRDLRLLPNPPLDAALRDVAEKGVYVSAEERGYNAAILKIRERLNDGEPVNSRKTLREMGVQLEALFRSVDVNGNGTISLDEFRALLQQLQLAVSPPELDAIATFALRADAGGAVGAGLGKAADDDDDEVEVPYDALVRSMTDFDLAGQPCDVARAVVRYCQRARPRATAFDRNLAETTQLKTELRALEQQRAEAAEKAARMAREVKLTDKLASKITPVPAGLAPADEGRAARKKQPKNAAGDEMLRANVQENAELRERKRQLQRELNEQSSALRNLQTALKTSTSNTFSAASAAPPASARSQRSQRSRRADEAALASQDQAQDQAQAPPKRTRRRDAFLTVEPVATAIPFRVYVKKDLSVTLDELKAKIEKQEGLPRSHQRLVFRNRPLPEEGPLSAMPELAVGAVVKLVLQGSAQQRYKHEFPEVSQEAAIAGAAAGVEC